MSIRNAQTPLQWFVNPFLIDTPAKLDWPAIPSEETLTQTWKSWRTTDALAKFFATWSESLRSLASSITSPQNIRWWAVALAVGLIGWYFVMGGGRWRQRLINAGRAAGIVLLLVIICIAIELYGKTFRGSVWMPRYLGMIWPAFAIAVSVLLCRLPTRVLRVGAIGVLIDRESFGVRRPRVRRLRTPGRSDGPGSD